MLTAEDTEDAFTALSDTTRIAILRTLWDAEDNEATFSQLRNAVGMSDSGQFNYHLDRLTGRFVTKTERGYELTIAGQLVYGSILSGAYGGEVAIDPIPLEDPCPACGGNRTLSYEDETVVVDCDSCDITIGAGVPPGVFAGYDREEIPAVTNRYFRTIVQQIDNGFCWYCEGKTTPTVEPMDDDVTGADSDGGHDHGHDDGGHDHGHDDDGHGNGAYVDESLPLVQYECERCGIEMTVNLGNSLLTHPAVVSFYYDHGVDVTETSIWKFATWNTDRTCIVDENPFTACVTYQADDDTLSLFVDEGLTVTEIQHS